jgi:putative ABC transport system substrate-binding protein
MTDISIQRSAISHRERSEKFMSKTILTLSIFILFLVPCFPTQAQQTAKVARIAVLSATTPSNLAARIAALRQGLRELGYVEGKNIIIEYRFAHGNLERQFAQARELVTLKVDVIVTGGPVGTRAAKNATGTIPIIMAQESDPVGSGFVASLSHPGGNITGLSTLSPEVSGKQLELLKEIVSNLSRVAVVGNTAEPGNAQKLRETQLAGGAFGIDVQYLELQARKDIETIFTSIKDQQAGSLILLRNPIAGVNRKRIIDLMVGNRLPGIHASPNWIKAGGLMYYGANIADIWRRAATYVDKILKGRKPVDLPVEQPTTFEFIANLKAAKQIGLTIPPNVLARANRVIR